MPLKFVAASDCGLLGWPIILGIYLRVRTLAGAVAFAADDHPMLGSLDDLYEIVR
jgi:hypothetical protein